MDTKKPRRAVEFYAGIGGFHWAIRESGLNLEVVAAFDINDVTNSIYAHNFPHTPLKQCNIQALSHEYLDQLEADIWMLSPPCQPFTRKGKQCDLDDRRCDSLKWLCESMSKMTHPPELILLENVASFADSSAHRLVLATLKAIGYTTWEFVLSPVALGIPNSRPRFYLLAKRDENRVAHAIATTLPDVASRPPSTINDYLDESDVIDSGLWLSEETLARHGLGLDIVDRDCVRSACFTKSYATFANGTGSVLATQSGNLEEFRRTRQAASVERRMQLLSSLKLRYFSPREMARLLTFPSAFTWPKSVTSKQVYRALGNSVCVRVVGQLLRFLHAQ